MVTEVIVFMRGMGQSSLPDKSIVKSNMNQEVHKGNDDNLSSYSTKSLAMEHVTSRHNHTSVVDRPSQENIILDENFENVDSDGSFPYKTTNDLKLDSKKDILYKTYKKRERNTGSQSEIHIYNAPTTIDTNNKNATAKDDSFHCDKCGKTFRVKSLLDAHRNRLLPCVGDINKVLKSQQDETINFTDREGMETSITVSKAFEIMKTECLICSFKTQRLSNLRRHFLITHCKDKPLKCHYCTSSFKLEESLNRHLLRYHANKEFSAFTCTLCKRVFSSHRHLEFHKVFKCTHRITKHTCDICDYSTRSKVAMATHRRLHTGEKPFKCPQCGTSLANQNSLKQHMDLHSTECRYECEACGMKFRTKAQYVNHVKLHKDDAMHGCSVCGKKYRNKSSLQYHVLTHTGSKPFVCESCGKAFRLKGRLQSHKQRLHAGVKMHHCQVCQKGFATSGSLQVHTLIHGERHHTCDRCGKSFYRKGKLTQHYKTHEKRYCCEQCTSKFTSLNELKKHTREHQGNSSKCSKTKKRLK